MRFLVASCFLLACGEGVEDGDVGSVDATLDAGSEDADTGTDMGTDAGENPLAALSDEFDDPALSEWTQPASGTVEVEDGWLIVTSTSGIWEDERENFFFSRGAIEGDFIMRAHVRASRVDDPSMPPFLEFNSVGIMARDPNGANGPENWALNHAGFQSTDLGTRSAFTLDGNSIQEIRATTGAELDLVLCRIGNGFRMYYLTPEYPDAWTNSGFFEWRTFPETLEVGIALDTFGIQPHLRGEVDWIRFAVPAVWDDCTADIPPAP